MLDMKSVMLALVAVFFLGMMCLMGYDIGRKNLVVDIDTYGCEKVLATYHGIKK
jgi:hypothetical protein